MNRKNFNLLKEYNKILYKIDESNRSYPHPEKSINLVQMGGDRYWFYDLLCEKYLCYTIFYDRRVGEILEMSDKQIIDDMKRRLYKFCIPRLYIILRSHEFCANYYIQPFINLSNDYNISLQLNNCEEGVLVPRNFFKVINRFRNVYNRVNKEVRDELGKIDCFSVDVVNIVLSYVL